MTSHFDPLERSPLGSGGSSSSSDASGLSFKAEDTGQSFKATDTTPPGSPKAARLAGGGPEPLSLDQQPALPPDATFQIHDITEQRGRRRGAKAEAAAAAAPIEDEIPEPHLPMRNPLKWLQETMLTDFGLDITTEEGFREAQRFGLKLSHNLLTKSTNGVPAGVVSHRYPDEEETFFAFDITWTIDYNGNHREVTFHFPTKEPIPPRGDPQETQQAMERAWAVATGFTQYVTSHVDTQQDAAKAAASLAKDMHATRLQIAVSSEDGGIGKVFVGSVGSTLGASKRSEAAQKKKPEAEEEEEKKKEKEDFLTYNMRELIRAQTPEERLRTMGTSARPQTGTTLADQIKALTRDSYTRAQAIEMQDGIAAKRQQTTALASPDIQPLLTNPQTDKAALARVATKQITGLEQSLKQHTALLTRGRFIDERFTHEGDKGMRFTEFAENMRSHTKTLKKLDDGIAKAQGKLQEITQNHQEAEGPLNEQKDYKAARSDLQLAQKKRTEYLEQMDAASTHFGSSEKALQQAVDDIMLRQRHLRTILDARPALSEAERLQMNQELDNAALAQEEARKTLAMIKQEYDNSYVAMFKRIKGKLF